MGRVEKDSTLHQRFASVDATATATATALTKSGTGNTYNGGDAWLC